DQPLVAETDTLGRFRFEDVRPGRYALTARLLGYRPLTVPELLVGSGKEVVLDLLLEPGTDTLAEVVVRAPLAAPMSTCILPVVTIEQTFRFPATFYDPARLAIQFPAMITWNDQGNLLVARGNSPNQNAWLLEGVPIVNPNHTPNAGTFTDQVTLSGGGVNMLSAQMLGTSTFYVGAPPAAVGDATGALLDMRLRRGNDRQTEGTFQLSLIGIDLAGEGPFGKKERAARPSWLANYRYSTVGLLTALGMDFGGEAISFQDLAAAIDLPTDKGHWKVFALAGTSSNVFHGQPADSLREEAKDRLDIDFGSQVAAFGVSHHTTLPDGQVWKTTVVQSLLRSNWQAAFVDDGAFFGSEKLAQTWTAFRTALSGARSDALRWSAGLAGRYLDESDDFHFAERQQQGAGRMAGLWLNPWLQLDRTSGRWHLRLGLRGHYFSWNGSRSLDPRLETRYRLSANDALYSSWGFYSQLHAVRVYATATDHDGQLLNRDLPLLRSQQATLGWEH
ncbi:MAG: carboxypeptidase regulatory-like domain-containing protein, partial [Bacteroidetes bacterium]